MLMRRAHARPGRRESGRDHVSQLIHRVVLGWCHGRAARGVLERLHVGERATSATALRLPNA